MIEIKYFSEAGEYDGNILFADHAVTQAALVAAEELFQAGGHCEVWRDDVRIFDDPATSLDSLTDQFAAAKAI